MPQSDNAKAIILGWSLLELSRFGVNFFHCAVMYIGKSVWRRTRMHDLISSVM